MYSVDINDNRVMIQCNFIKPRFLKCSAVYDTGAQHTFITALSLDPNLTEDDFIDSEQITVGGLIDSQEINIIGYKIHVLNFYLGNIHITGVDVWVTFDDRVTDNIVGMDVLCRVNRLSIAYSGKELFFKDTQEMLDYTIQVSRKIKECISNIESHISLGKMSEKEAIDKCKNKGYADFEIQEALKQCKETN